MQPVSQHKQDRHSMHVKHSNAICHRSSLNVSKTVQGKAWADKQTDGAMSFSCLSVRPCGGAPAAVQLNFIILSYFSAGSRPFLKKFKVFFRPPPHQNPSFSINNSKNGVFGKSWLWGEAFFLLTSSGYSAHTSTSDPLRVRSGLLVFGLGFR